MLPLLKNNPPSWVLSGAKVDLDFANSRYWGGGISLGSASAGGAALSTQVRMNSLLTEFIAGGGGAANTYYAPGSDGFYYTTPANGLRITPGRGLWIENNAINWCLQSRVLTNAAWTISNSTDLSVTRTGIAGADRVVGSGNRITCSVNNGTITQNNLSFGMFGGDGITIDTAGTGYAANNNLTLVGGTLTTATQIQVQTVSGGAVTAIYGQTGSFVKVAGAYTVRPTFPADVTGGAGTGAQFTLDDTYIFSALVKRITGSGAVSITVDGTNYTPITSQINTTGYTLVYVISANPSSISCGFKVAVSGDVIDVDMCQLEAALEGIHAPTTRIITTSAAVPRGNISGSASSGEEAFFNNPSVAAGYNQGWNLINGFFSNHMISALVIGAGNGASGCLLTGTDLGFFFTGGLDGSNIDINNGSAIHTTSSNTGNTGIDVTNKMAFSLSGGGGAVYLNGVATTDGSNKFNNVQNTHGGIGNRGAGDLPINGCIQRVVYWDRPLTLGEGIEYTR